MEKEKFDLGYVIEAQGTPDEKLLKRLAGLTIFDESGRATSIRGLEDDVFEIFITNTKESKKEQHTQLILSRGSLIALLVAGPLYFLNNDEESVFINETKSYLSQEGLVVDFRVRE